MAEIRGLRRERDGAARAAIFLSGSGSNAERLLERWRAEARPPLTIVALVTDRPQQSRAAELGEQFGVPVVGHDIKAYYEHHGCRRITIATPEGRALRASWTAELVARLAPLELDFALFAGFVPLTNLAEVLPCLNVHPGDLTYEVGGARHLVGLHTLPIERAILAGLPSLRTSVILAEPYSGRGEDMDSGPILGLSPAVPIDLQGQSLASLQAIAAARPAERPVGGYRDALETLAQQHQELLKQGGDWVVFPRVAWAFAEGRYGVDPQRRLYWRQDGQWQPIRTTVCVGEALEPLPR
jgi:folate-dependent phosphoribosylglycinamide formyltransferase PurN